MAVCSEVVPPEVTLPDGIRVACHLYPAGSDGVPVTTPRAVRHSSVGDGSSGAVEARAT
jgi:hypothetical protein